MTRPLGTRLDPPIRSERQPFWHYLKDRQVDFFPTGALRWWLLGLVVLAWTVQEFERQKLGPVLPYVLNDFHTSLVTWGNIQVAGELFQAAGGVLLGTLADRFGRKPVIVIPTLLYVGVMIMGALAPDMIVFAISVFLGSLLTSGMSPAVLAVARDLSPKTGRALNFGFISVAYTMGALLATGVASLTIPIWPGFRPQFWIGAIVAGVVFVLLAIFYKDLSSRIRGQILRNQLEARQAEVRAAGFTSERDAFRAGFAVYRSWRLWTLAAAMIFWGITYATVGFYVPLYLTDYYGMEVADSAGMVTFFWLVFTASVVVSGWLSDRLLLRKSVIAFGAVTTGVMFGILASLPPTTSFGLLAVVWAITGWFAGFIYPAWCALLSENAEDISPFGVGRAFSTVPVLGLVGGLGLHFGLPRVVESAGWPTWMMLAAGSCLMIVVLVAVGGRGPWLRRPRLEPTAAQSAGTESGATEPAEGAAPS